MTGGTSIGGHHVPDTTQAEGLTVRKLVAAIVIIALLLLGVACQGDAGPAGEQGPPGPPGPAWRSRTGRAYRSRGGHRLSGSGRHRLDHGADARTVGRRLAHSPETGLRASGQLDHLIIENTRNPAFKERLSGLDREIHRVFESAAAAAPDQETVQTSELMEGIVVLSIIMDAIAEAKIAAAKPPAPAPPKWEPASWTPLRKRVHPVLRQRGHQQVPVGGSRCHRRLLQHQREH